MGAYYPIEGGMLKGMQKGKKQIHHMAFSELSTVKDVLKELDSHRENDSIFLELLACKGGCINGPAN
ncbi:MAG: [Fe-Fe] hydrogenase large subunit C-terminal domain-containing protein [Butyricimonas faecihominis]